MLSTSGEIAQAFRTIDWNILGKKEVHLPSKIHCFLSGRTTGSTQGEAAVYWSRSSYLKLKIPISSSRTQFAVVKVIIL